MVIDKGCKQFSWPTLFGIILDMIQQAELKENFLRASEDYYLKWCNSCRY